MSRGQVVVLWFVFLALTSSFAEVNQAVVQGASQTHQLQQAEKIELFKNDGLKQETIGNQSEVLSAVSPSPASLDAIAPHTHKQLELEVNLLATRNSQEASFPNDVEDAKTFAETSITGNRNINKDWLAKSDEHTNKLSSLSTSDILKAKTKRDVETPPFKTASEELEKAFENFKSALETQTGQPGSILEALKQVTDKIVAAETKTTNLIDAEKKYQKLKVDNGFEGGDTKDKLAEAIRDSTEVIKLADEVITSGREGHGVTVDEATKIKQKATDFAKAAAALYLRYPDSDPKPCGRAEYYDETANRCVDLSSESSYVPNPDQNGIADKRDMASIASWVISGLAGLLMTVMMTKLMYKALLENYKLEDSKQALYDLMQDTSEKLTRESALKKEKTHLKNLQSRFQENQQQVVDGTNHVKCLEAIEDRLEKIEDEHENLKDELDVLRKDDKLCKDFKELVKKPRVRQPKLFWGLFLVSIVIQLFSYLSIRYQADPTSDNDKDDKGVLPDKAWYYFPQMILLMLCFVADFKKRFKRDQANQQQPNQQQQQPNQQQQQPNQQQITTHNNFLDRVLLSRHKLWQETIMDVFSLIALVLVFVRGLTFDMASVDLGLAFSVMALIQIQVGYAVDHAGTMNQELKYGISGGEYLPYLPVLGMILHAVLFPFMLVYRVRQQSKDKAITPHQLQNLHYVSDFFGCIFVGVAVASALMNQVTPNFSKNLLSRLKNGAEKQMAKLRHFESLWEHNPSPRDDFVLGIASRFLEAVTEIDKDYFCAAVANAEQLSFKTKMDQDLIELVLHKLRTCSADDQSKSRRFRSARTTDIGNHETTAGQQLKELKKEIENAIEKKREGTGTTMEQDLTELYEKYKQHFSSSTVKSDREFTTAVEKLVEYKGQGIRRIIELLTHPDLVKEDRSDNGETLWGLIAAGYYGCVYNIIDMVNGMTGDQLIDANNAWSVAFSFVLFMVGRIVFTFHVPLLAPKLAETLTMREEAMLHLRIASAPGSTSLKCFPTWDQPDEPDFPILSPPKDCVVLCTPVGTVACEGFMFNPRPPAAASAAHVPTMATVTTNAARDSPSANGGGVTGSGGVNLPPTSNTAVDTSSRSRVSVVPHMGASTISQSSGSGGVRTGSSPTGVSNPGHADQIPRPSLVEPSNSLGGVSHPGSGSVVPFTHRLPLIPSPNGGAPLLITNRRHRAYASAYGHGDTSPRVIGRTHFN